MRRRTLLGAATAVFVPAMPYVARAESSPGVTDTEIRIGSTAAFSGPASAYGAIGRAQGAAWQWFNDEGGIAGRKVKFLCYDDSYSPPKAIEQVRRLVEQDEVACLSNTLGTAANTAFLKYVNQKKVPDLFVGSGADKFQDPVGYPWTLGWQPSYRVEARIFAQYILKTKAGRQDRNPLSERRFRQGLRQRLPRRAGRQFRQGKGGFLRGHRHRDRQPGDLAAGGRRQCAAVGGDAEVRGADHSQDRVDGLEAAASADQRVDLGGCGDGAGRTRKGRSG